jgi:hypothetical protein
MNYQELKAEYKLKLDKLLESSEVFWAFNESQLQEGITKHNISKDNKLVRIGAGGFLPSKNFEKFNNGMKELTAWEKEEKRKMKEDKKQLVTAVLYELNNHECFYTGELDDVYSIFPDVPRQEITKIYLNNRDGIN